MPGRSARGAGILNESAPQPTSLDAAMRLWVARRPRRRLFAFVNGEGEIVEDLSYRDFAARVDTLAAQLAARSEKRACPW